MARRKKGFMSDGSDSDGSADSGFEDGYNSQEDGDSRAERALFERKRKRPRTDGRSGKEAAWEGIFGEDDAPRGGLGARGGRAGIGGNARVDWTKAPMFAKASSKPESRDKTEEPSDQAVEANSEASDDDSNASDSDASSSSGPSRPASPRVREEEEEDEKPRGFSGMAGSKNFLTSFGFGQNAAKSATAPSAPSAPSFAAAGSSPAVASPASGDEPSAPSAFGKRAAALRQAVESNNPRSNFQPSRSTTPSGSTLKAHELTKSERQHFSKISSNIGTKLLANMGWTPGKGLGVQEDGLAVPLSVGKMMRGEGIRSGIRTEESKREARRRGELVEEEEPEKKPRGRKGDKSRPKAHATDGWKKQKRVKVTVEHKTYEQLLAEEGDKSKGGVGLVLDARTGEYKTVESLAELSLSPWGPTSDATQLPELRHNLKLILDSSRTDVGNLVKEGKSVNERRRWSLREEERAKSRVEATTNDISRLESVQEKIQFVSTTSVTEAKKECPSLHSLEDAFNSLVIDYKDEYALLSLDEVVVGAIDVVLGRSFTSFRPFDISADALLANLKPWRKAFNLSEGETESRQSTAERQMTAWESLLWHRWLPNVRAAINNEWDATQPNSAVHLVESWEPILPVFIRDNIMDQLIMPKVRTAVEQWSGRSRTSLASIIFPWLPTLGDRGEDLLTEAKRRIRSALRKWNLTDGVIEELGRWKDDIYTSSEWDKLMAEHILGKLGACLRDDFVINPRNQNMEPLLKWVMPWHTLIRPSNFARLFELEFFPKWLNVLYLWLVHPGYSGDEVARWFEMWKGVFPPSVLARPGIAHGFDAGLRLMSEAMSLGSDAPSKLQKPRFEPLRPSKSSNGTSKPLKGVSTVPKAPAPGSLADDITFRSIVEDIVAGADLLMLPTGQSHTSTGKPLLRVGKTIDGKGGVIIYIDSDAVFAKNQEGDFRAIGLEDLVKLAGGS